MTLHFAMSMITHFSLNHSWFSHDVTAAMLVPLNKETVAILVSQIDP